MHPAAIAVYAIQALRQAAVPLIVVVGASVFGGGTDSATVRGALFALAGALASAVVGAIRWAATTYSVADGRIRLRRGWISTKEVEIPVARVQSLDLEQGPVQRLFGVQAVHVQTGGGGQGGEIVLDALAPAEIERLRELVARRRPDALPEADRDLPVRRLSRRELALAALTSGQIGVILPVLAALSQTVNDVVQDPVRGEQTAERLLPDSVLEWLLAAGGLLALAWLLAAAGTVVAFSGFTAQRDGDFLRVRRGLLARRDATLPVARVRAVRVVEGVLRQPFGLATLRIEVIGYAKEPAAARTLFPLLRRREVEPLLASLLPELADGPDGLDPPPARAHRRYLLPPAAAGLLVGAAAALALGTPWPLAVALAGGLGYGELRWRAAGWRFAGGRLAVASRALARTTVLAPARNRESHDLAQTPLQRRARLADVAVAFGKGTTAQIRHLDEHTARVLWSEIA